MGREELRRAIFRIIEFVNQYEMSDTAKKLVLHYFNGSKEASSYERAIEAIFKYAPDGFTEDKKESTRLQEMFVHLKRVADAWDRE